MRDSLMLSSLTVGEKQHPKLGGCVRVFFQLFDWNRRLACKKRFFSQKQLPAERPLWRTSSYCKDGRGAAPFNTDPEPMLFICNGEEEDNLHIKVDCSMEETGGEDIRRDRDDVMHEAGTTSSGLFSVHESIIEESCLMVKDPGVIGRLMGLEYLPSLPCEKKKEKVSQLCHTTTVHAVDPPPCLQSTPTEIIAQDDNKHTPTVILAQDVDKQKVHSFALEHGLPEEELNALLAELNGNIFTILSALPPHLDVSGYGPRTASSRIHSTARMNSRTGASSPSSSCPAATFTRTPVNPTSSASSPSNSTCPAPAVTRTHVNTTTGASSPSGSCAATIPRTHNDNMKSALASAFSTCPGTAAPQTSVNFKNAPVSNEHSFIRTPSFNPERKKLAKSNHLEGSQSIENQWDDFSELEEQMLSIPRERDGDVGTIKSVKRVKGKSSTVGGKALSEGCVNASSVKAAREEVKLQCNTQLQEVADVGKGTCKPWRRKKVDILQEEEGFSSTHYDVRGERAERGGERIGVRGTFNDQRGTTSTGSAGFIHSQHLPSNIPSDTNFDIKYNVAFFDEYHTSKSSLKNCSDDHGLDRAKQSKLINRASERVAAHDQTTSLECSSPVAGAKEEELSLMRVLLKRRAAREAAAAATLEAAGILETKSLVEDKSAVACKYGSKSLQGMISSCSTSSPLDTDLVQRREKLSAGRSEAGGGNFMQVPNPIISNEHSRAAARRHCVYEESCTGDDNQCAHDAMGSIMTEPGMSRQWTTSCAGNERADHDVACMQQQAKSVLCTLDCGGGRISTAGGVQLEICGAAHPGCSKNTTAAILQDVICALNATQSTPHSKPVSSARPRHQSHHSDDDDGTPSTADGHDTESTSDSGGCWAAASSQPSPVSVLLCPFDDDASPAGDHDNNTCWIQSEEDYVAALLAATSESGATTLPPVELFRKLEERVEAAWPDSEVRQPTPGYRRLVFDCVCEAMSEAVASKECKGDRRWRARVLFEEMCRWRQDASEIVLDDLVEADLGKPCNRWLAFDVQTQDTVVLLEGTIFELLVEELVCDLVLS